MDPKTEEAKTIEVCVCVSARGLREKLRQFGTNVTCFLKLKLVHVLNLP